MSLQTRITAALQLIGLDIKSKADKSICEYRTKSGTANFSTTQSTVDFDVSVISDGLLSYSAGEFTVLAAANGKRLRVDYSLGGTGATNRVELEAYLQLDTGGGFNTIKQASNYSARNATQDTGGVSGFHILDSVQTGDVIRLQADRVGSNAFNDPLQTSILFETRN